MALIWAAVKDTGGTNAVMPIVEELHDLGHQIILLPSGIAKKRLTNKDFVHQVDSPEEALEKLPKPDVFITSMCHGAIGRDLVRLLRGKCLTIAVQDYWGGGLKTDWEPDSYRPDYIFVTDELADGLVRDHWHYPKERIIKTGWLAFESHLDDDLRVMEFQVKKSLGIDLNTPIVSVIGSGLGSSHILNETALALKTNGKKIACIARAHPEMKRYAPDEIEPWERLIKENSFCNGNESFLCPDALIAASRVVISTFTTLFVLAAIFRKQVISIMYPSHIQAEFERVMGNILQQEPTTLLEASVRANNRQEFRAYFEKALAVQIRLPGQTKHFRLRSGMAKRAAEFIVNSI